MENQKGLLHGLRVVAGSALVGTVVAGALFGWIPVAGAVSVHAVGAIAGAGLGAVATRLHLV